MTSTPDYSIVIPAFNEERFLPETLSNVIAAMDACPYTGEIIVVDNNSTDETSAVATSFGAQVVIEPINQISRARNAGAAAAEGRYLIFLDADTIVTSSVLVTALRALDLGETCGGGALVSIEHPNVVANAAVVVWRVLSQWMRLAAGCFIYCRRDAFEAVGGFSENVYASEEIWFSREMKRWGLKRKQRFVIIPESVLTSARKADWLSTPAIIKQVAVFLLFPFAVRYRRYCGAWYVRPDTSDKTVS